MDLKVIEVRLSADWKQVVKKSSFWITSAVGGLWLIMPEIANQWPQAAPFVTHYFPADIQQSVGGAIGAVLIILAKISFIRVGKKRDGDQ